MEAISSDSSVANDGRLLTRFDSLQIDDERLSLPSEHNYDHQPTWPAWPGSSWRVGEKKEAWTLDHFDIGKQLGKGQLGSVFLAREKSTKSIVALKLMKEAKFYKVIVFSFCLSPLSVITRFASVDATNPLFLFSNLYSNWFSHITLAYPCTFWCAFACTFPSLTVSKPSL